MKGFTVELEGYEKVLTDLNKYNEQVADRVDDVLKNGSAIIAGKARQMAPVDLGALKGSIHSGPVRKLTWEVVAGVHYAPYVEFGTGTNVKVPAGMESYAMQFKSGNPFVGKKRVKIKDKWVTLTFPLNLRPHPFLFPALMSYRKQLIEDIKAELKNL